jgi:predicted enzyme related to lactoylglutathione lyase
MLTKLTHLTLFVNDQEEALEFYKKLGFVVHTDAPFGPMLRWLTLCLPQDNQFELVLMKAESDAEKALVGKQGGDKPFFTLATDDCRGDYERLKRAGVDFVQEPQDEPWGVSMACTDSAGNAIYIVQS